MPAPFLNGVLGCAAAQEKCFACLRESSEKEQPSRMRWLFAVICCGVGLGAYRPGLRSQKTCPTTRFKSATGVLLRCVESGPLNG